MELVIKCLEEYKKIVPQTKKIGAVDTLWTNGLRKAWGLSKGVRYWYWLAPGNVVTGEVNEKEIAKEKD